MNEDVIYPFSVKAFRLPSGKVSICVQGIEFGFKNLKIVQAPMPIFPANYMLEGERRELVSMTPYNFCQPFDYPLEIHELYFLMEKGWERVEIRPVLEIAKTVSKDKLQFSETSIMGLALNSTDLNAAFTDAVNTARSQFPGEISLKWDSAGFFAEGGPVGVAATWVSLTIEQQLDSSAN